MAEGTGALIELKNATMSFGKNKVLREVDFQLWPGQLVAVVGINGAGKTTLLRVLAGLLGLDQGELLISGKPLDRMSEAQRENLFFLPDFPSFFEEQTVLENIGLWINLYGRGDSGREECALKWLEEFALMEKVKQWPGALSRGQRYKLALTCYEAVEARIGLFDEPFASGIDSKAIHSMRKLIRGACESGRSVIYTTQLIDYALEFADRIMVIENNEIYFDDSPAEFRTRLTNSDKVLSQYAE
jgi:ABC-type multidrug transport system ATPase subunit